MTDTSFENGIRDTVDRASEQLSEAVANVKDKAQDIGRRAADKMNETRSSAASGLESAASALHEKAENLPGVEAVRNAAHCTANNVACSADYLRTHALKDVISDVGRCVSRNPGTSILTAVFTGFMVGRMFRDR